MNRLDLGSVAVWCHKCGRYVQAREYYQHECGGSLQELECEWNEVELFHCLDHFQLEAA